jgi:hypothetical protein
VNLISGPVDRTSSPQAKIALFRSLFRGREDVYPRRFENRRTGKSGYAPACANEWVRGVCEKPRIRCAECPNRRFLPVTDDVIRWHLSGCDPEGQSFVAGVYPLLQDETCFFLAVDFDKAGWREDAAALLETCRCLDLPAAFERSRSGRGAHVWFFFEEAIPAALARRLGSHVLTETMERRPDIGLDSYDRLFPNQDTMPQGGFGNLIALPLQRSPRKHDNSIFLDSNYVPWADQWAFLASVRKISRSRVEGIVQEAERRGRVLGVRLPPQEDGEDEPWTAPPSRHQHASAQTTRVVGPGRKEASINGDLPSTLELASPWESDLRGEGRIASGPSKSVAPAGCVSESRVLQSAGDAAFDVQQASRYRVRRGPPASHRVASRMPRRCSQNPHRSWCSHDGSRRTLHRRAVWT